MAAGDIVQVASGQSAGSAEAELSSAPTAGNTLVAVCAHRAADGTVSLDTSGWTEVGHFKSQIGNSSARRAVAVLIKPSGDPLDQLVLATWSTNRTNGLILMEIEGEWEAQPDAASFDDTGTGSGTQLTSGQVAASGLGVAVAVARLGDSSDGFYDFDGWTEAGEQIVGVTGANGATMAAAVQLVSSPAEASAEIGSAALWTLGLVVLEGEGGATPVNGTLNAALPLIEVSVSATVTVQGTVAAALPLLQAEASGTVGDSDAVEEFDGATIPDGWTYVDPKGDTTLSFADGCAVIELPAGSTHDSLPADTAPKLLRDAPEGAWEVTASWRSQVRYPATQGQGLVVCDASNNTLIRADVYGDNDGVCRVFLRHGSTTVVSGVAVPRGLWGGSPSHLRLSFDGDDGWEFFASVNGFDWDTLGAFTAAITPAKVGVHALNATGAIPAHTARLDRFTFDGSMPPEPPDDQGTLVISEPFDGGDGDPWPTGRWEDASVNGGYSEQNGDGTAVVGHDTGPDSAGRALTTVANLRDIRIAGRSRFHSNDGTHASFLALAIRGTGGWGDIYSPVNSYALERNHKDGKLRLFRVNGAGSAGNDLDDAYHLLSQADDITYGDVDTDWHRFEFEANGPWVRFRIWPDGESRPAEWTVKAVDFVNDQPGEVGVAMAQTWAAGTVDAEAVDVADLQIWALEDYAVSGALDAVLPLIEAEATAAVTVSGDVDATLPLIQAEAAGTVDTDPYDGDAVVGELDAQLPLLEAEAAGQVTVTGTAAATLPLIDAVVAGRVTARGDLDATLPLIQASIAGEVTESEDAVTGTLDATLPLLQVAITGTSAHEPPPYSARYEAAPLFTETAGQPHRFLDGTVAGRFLPGRVAARFDEADPLPVRFHAHAQPGRFFTATVYRLTGDPNMELQVVDFGPFTQGDRPQALWVRCFDKDPDGADQPMVLHGTEPEWTARVAILPPSGEENVITRAATIPDPDQLATIEPRMSGRNGEDGWVIVTWEDGDFDEAGAPGAEYQVQVILDNTDDGGAEEFGLSTIYQPNVRPGPATLDLVGA